MLSRVAAVKAPRTHNRRCVTGSSGRRREGRESGKQRPNMSRHVFTSAVLLLLLVVMMCDTGGAASAGGSNVKKAVGALMGIGWEKLDNWEDVPDAGGKYGSLRGPSLVDLQGHVFAVAEAHCKDEEKCSDVSFTGIASKYLGLNVDSGSMEISTADASIFGTGLLKEGSGGIHTANGITRPTTLVLGESVYMLLGNQNHKKPPVEGTNERCLLLVKGTLTDEGGNNKKIRWNETLVVKPHGKGESLSLAELIGGGGSGAVMDDGSLVFPMQAKNRDGTSVLLSMSFDPSENKWELPQITPGKGCRDPTLVKWEEDKDDERLFMMAHCAGGYYDVYRSTENGGNWNGHFQPITRVWGNTHNRKGHGVQSGFTTAIIEEKKVMLITAPVYPKDDGKGRLHLWVTDKARVFDVGPVSRKDDDAAASSLLMKGDNNELISLYENNKEEKYNLVALSLTEKLERIKEVVKTWKDLDSALKTCSSGSSGNVDARKKGMCKARVPIDELVGFLSGNFSDGTWRDEYLGVNAKVHGPAEKRREVPNGLTFKGSGAGAVWPVGEMGQTVPYYFANNEFTLVATVSIHEVPQSGSIPLMGVRMNDTKGTVLFGLSYTHDKKWLAISEDPATSKLVDEWEPNKTYQVGLRMDEEKWTVIVDGKEIHNTNYNEDLFDFHRISHFYIGGDSKHQSATGGHVTVTNVMLYNEKLWGDKLYKLNASKVTIPSLSAEKQPTGQVTGTDALVASEPKSEESASHEELNEDDIDEQEENSADDLAPAASSSEAAAGSSVPEPAIAVEIAENSLQKDNAQFSGGETSQQFTPHEDYKSMKRGSDLQTQDPQSEESTEVADVEGFSESNDAQQPVKDGEANDRSGKSTSSVSASSDMDTATETVDSEQQVQQSTELSTENEGPRSTGTGTTDAGQSFSLEARDGNSKRTMNSDSSLTSSKSDAETTSAENTDNISWTERAEVSSEEGKEALQTVDTAPASSITAPGKTKIPSESNATAPSDTDILLEKGQFGELAAIYITGDSTVHGCVSPVLLLLPLGLWGIAALC
ncbi:putative trans-sialidase, Group VIII [Trypanosoma cruzi]|nr:putative trans-sialidase, Group VIII [Trypanosoma cruzi]